MAVFNPKKLRYAACYCEENIYLLCEEALSSKASVSTHVLLISGNDGFCPVYHQRNGGEGSSKPVWWDYHVVMIHGNLVYDYDTLLGFPCELKDYVEKSFRPHLTIHDGKSHEHVFRLVGAKSYVDTFASDRRHMRIGSVWQVSPPPWPCIRGQNSEIEHNLDLFIATLPPKERSGPGVDGTLEEGRPTRKDGLDTSTPIPGKIMMMTDLLTFVEQQTST